MTNGLVMLLVGIAVQVVTTVDAETFDLSPDRNQYCRKADGSEVDLQAVALLQNKKFDLQPYGVAAVLSLDRDWIDIKGAEGSKVRPYRQDIGYAAVPGESLDVDLSIALYQGRALLHWKETYKHTAARLGLFAIKSDGRLEPLCIGGPTVIVSH